MDVWELGSYAWELAILRIVDALQTTKEMVTTIDIYEVLEQGTFKELTAHDLGKPPELEGKPLRKRSPEALEPDLPGYPVKYISIETTQLHNLEQFNKSLHRKWCRETKTAVPLSPVLSDIILNKF